MSLKTYTGNEGIREQADNLLWLGIIIQRSFKTQVITVGASAVLLPTAPLSKRKTLMIMNNSTSSQILYLGNNDVTTATGFPIYPRAVIRIDVEDSIDIYGVASAEGASICIFEGA